jgi:hypothetical protein
MRGKRVSEEKMEVWDGSCGCEQDARISGTALQLGGSLHVALSYSGALRKGFRIRMNCFEKLCLLLGVALLASACGYHTRSAVAKLPSGIESLGIPTFRNSTTQYKIEQLLTSAVLREFTLRTRAAINSRSTDVDSVLLGEIRGVSSVPVTYGTQTAGSQTFGSAFLVTVRVGVKLMRLSDSAVLWQNNDFLYRERYVLNTNVQDFFSEENPALERLAKSFAASLASTILDRSTP